MVAPDIKVISDRISRVPPYSKNMEPFTDTGLSPTMADLSKSFSLQFHKHWPSPRSLVTTKGVSVISFPPAT